jgi:hypothetical protein
MEGHHLILGELTDFLTGETLEDTLDERYRQKIARFLVEERGFRVAHIQPRRMLAVQAGALAGRVPVDLVVEAAGRAAMIVKFGPGSLTTRHRPALAIARLIAPAPVPVAVVTNGETADVLDGISGKVLGSGWDAIPDPETLARMSRSADAAPLSPKRAEMEARIVYAYEIDGACPCDTTVCRINGA